MVAEVVLWSVWRIYPKTPLLDHGGMDETSIRVLLSADGRGLRDAGLRPQESPLHRRLGRRLHPRIGR